MRTRKKISILIVSLLAVCIIWLFTKSIEPNELNGDQTGYCNARDYEKGYYESILSGEYGVGVNTIQEGVNHQSDDNGWTEGEKHRTYSATAFFSIAVAESYLSLENAGMYSIYKTNMDSWKTALEKANKFLMNEEYWNIPPKIIFRVPIHEEGAVPGHPFHNQIAAASFANYLTYLITDNSVYREDSQKLIDFIIEHQSEEGWYAEMGGPDTSYNAVTILMLQQIYRYNNNPALFSSISKSLSWEKTKILEDGTIIVKGNTRVRTSPDARAVVLAFWNWKENNPEYEAISNKVAIKYQVSRNVFDFYQ